MDEKYLKGRTAWVTGGATGMGRACALALARAGANVAIGSLTGAVANDPVRGEAAPGARRRRARSSPRRDRGIGRGRAGPAAQRLFRRLGARLPRRGGGDFRRRRHPGQRGRRIGPSRHHRSPGRAVAPDHRRQPHRTLSHHQAVPFRHDRAGLGPDHQSRDYRRPGRRRRPRRVCAPRRPGCWVSPVA